MAIDALELLRRLMACRPVTADPACVNRAVDVLREFLDGEGVSTNIEDLDGRSILYASTRDERRPDVLLNTHLDVVPAEDEMFQPREKDGFLYGRGTHDCLGNTVTAARALVRAGQGASVGAVFSTDEETGGATTHAMVERGYGAGRLAIVIDGDSYALTNAQKGILTVALRARGKACHAAHPWTGENAIDKLIDGYLRVRELFPEITPPDEWRDSMAATQLRGGTVVNRVPDEAEMTLNIRYTEADGADVIAGKIESASGLEVVRRGQCPPVVFSADTPALQELAACMERRLGRPVEIKRMNGATDARHFVALGVPIAIIGVPGADAHGPEERIDLAGFRPYEDMLVEFLQRF